MSPLVVNTAELSREPGRRKHVVATVDLAEVEVAHAAIPAGSSLAVDVTIESSIDDIVVTGAVTVPWRGACRRCLEPLADAIEVTLEERYSDDPGLLAAGEAAPIARDQLDLRDLVRDEVLLAIDHERLCRPDCAGLCPTCGANLNDGPCGCAAGAGDDRWAVLDQLRAPE